MTVIAIDPALWDAFAEDRDTAATGLECATCHRVLRPRRTTREDHPGTLLAVRKDSCSSCYGGREASRRQHIPHRTPCRGEGCGAPLRAASRKSKDHPGTRRHAGWGICSTCYERAVREGTLDHYRKG